MAEVSSKWKLIGTIFRLRQEKLEQIDIACSENPEECLLEVLKEWLRRNYDVARFGEPSWRKVVEALASPAAGNNKALALSIASEHPCKCLTRVK